jgi:hypothetical protein
MAPTARYIRMIRLCYPADAKSCTVRIKGSAVRLYDRPHLGRASPAERSEPGNGAVGDAHAGVVHFPIIGPAVVIGMTAALNMQAYRMGRITLSEYLRKVGERGFLALIAMCSGWAAKIISKEPKVGLPVSLVVRYCGGQAMHNVKRHKKLSATVQDVEDSLLALEARFPTLQLKP